MAVEIPITSATVPSPLDCVVSNANWQALVSLLQATFPNDSTIFNRGNTEPSPSNRVYPWFRYNADGSPDKWYVYSMGAWLSLHPAAPGTVVLYEGSAGSIDTFDGGEAGAVTSISGPMWERVTQMDGRFPVGPGTLQPSTTVIGVGDTGGVDEVELTEDQLAEHRHLIADPMVGSTALTSSTQTLDNDTAGGYTLEGRSDEEATVGKTSITGAGDPHTNLPPFLAIFAIRRTARLYYRI